MPPEVLEAPEPFLATSAHPKDGLGLSAADQVAAQTIAARLGIKESANTKRAYDLAWRDFHRWTDRTGHRSLPATHETIVLYLRSLKADGKALSTIEQARAAISHTHATGGTANADNPALHPVVAAVIKDWRNRAPVRKQAAAITTDALVQIRETARLPRRGRGGGMESEAAAYYRGDVDLAIVGVMADGGLRSSEAEVLVWGDVEFRSDGSARITIQKSKNQPGPLTVAITASTANALHDIMPASAAPAAPVFGLTAQTLAKRIRDAARAAGLGDSFSGNSGRIGMVQRMMLAGAPLDVIRQQGRWQHSAMVAHYTRDINVTGEALKWLS